MSDSLKNKILLYHSSREIVEYPEIRLHRFNDVQLANGMDVIELVIEIYTSWLDKALSNYNSDLYYQPREYISLCYKEGKICA